MKKLKFRGASFCELSRATEPRFSYQTDWEANKSSWSLFYYRTVIVQRKIIHELYVWFCNYRKIYFWERPISNNKIMWGGVFARPIGTPDWQKNIILVNRVLTAVKNSTGNSTTPKHHPTFRWSSPFRNISRLLETTETSENICKKTNSKSKKNVSKSIRRKYADKILTLYLKRCPALEDSV